MDAENTKKPSRKCKECNLHNNVYTQKAKQPPTPIQTKPSPAPPPTKNLPSVTSQQKVRKESLFPTCWTKKMTLNKNLIHKREDDDPELAQANKLIWKPLKKREKKGVIRTPPDSKKLVPLPTEDHTTRKLSKNPSTSDQKEQIRDTESVTFNSSSDSSLNRGHNSYKACHYCSLLQPINAKLQQSPHLTHEITFHSSPDLNEKILCVAWPRVCQELRIKKSSNEILNCQKGQDEETNGRFNYTISQQITYLEEFNLKSALFCHMNKKKSANKNTTNYRLYHALMEALIADEDAMDKEVADKVKDHKRKHDSDDDEDDDDDEGPSAGSKPGVWSYKENRSDLPASSSLYGSDPESEHSEQSSDDISKQDEGNDSDMEDTDNAHIPKVSTTTWFKPIPESERPATPEPEWSIPPNDFPEPEQNWANAYASTFKVPEENKLQRKTYDIGSFIKWFCRRTGKKKLCKADLEGPAFNLVKAFHKNSVFLQYQMDECHKLLTNKVDLYNPEGHQIQRNVDEPLPLGGPPGQVTIQPQFFFNKDLDYLLTGDKERRIALSISKLKAARYLYFGLEELVPTLWVESEREYDISAVYGITHWWFRRKEFYINKHSESSDREAVRSQMRILSVISVKVFEKYGYNYLREIILRRADYQEYKISEKDFKNLHPNDFEDLFLLNIQEKLNHLPRTDKISLHYQQSYMWIRKPADYYFKEDYTIVPKPRAVVYRDRNNREIGRILGKGGGVLLRPHKGVKASANTESCIHSLVHKAIHYKIDVRSCLGNDLKKAQDHCQRQTSDGVAVSVPTAAPQGLAILLTDAATQTEGSEGEVSLRLIRSKSLPPMFNSEWP
ncbi:hypothetical protein Tco_0593221 [Tanacetum coccineum]